MRKKPDVAAAISFSKPTLALYLPGGRRGGGGDALGIRQLASELRLSIGTVSRALNDRPDVNPETRARVKAAALRAGYVPNQSGRSLRSGRTGIVAAVIPAYGVAPQSDAGLFMVLEGARRTLQRRALDLIVLFRGSEEDPLLNLQRIVQRRIADSIIVSQTMPNDPRIAWMKAEGVEFVAFGRAAGLDDYPSVDFDFEGVAAEAARIFVRDGHRRLAVTVGERIKNYESLLLQALRAEASRLGIGAGAVTALPTEAARLTEAACAALAHEAEAPTAVLASHETLAMALYDEFARLGRRVGPEVSVICTFPVIGARGLVPALSYFEADLDAVGVALADHLLAKLPDAPADLCPPPSRLVPLSFVPRDSHQPAGSRVRA
jgi:DNA-binding LacI/PurR family transcriptional regulator